MPAILRPSLGLIAVTTAFCLAMGAGRAVAQTEHQPLATGAKGKNLVLTIADGRASIDAENVSLREILLRWSETGPATFAGMERIPDERVTLRLDDVSDDALLAILLRGAGGFLLVRGASGADSHRVDRIWILPRSSMQSNDTANVNAISNRVDASVPFGVSPNEPAQDHGLEPALQITVPVNAGVSAQPAGIGATGTGRAPSDPAARPTPIQYLDSLDVNGERKRAPSVPVFTPPPPVGQPVPANPFGVKTGTAQPQAASPTTTGK